MSGWAMYSAMLAGLALLVTLGLLVMPFTAFALLAAAYIVLLLGNLVRGI